MTQNLLQTSFAAGELSPALAARTDLAKYKTGLAQCRNFFVDYRGGVSTRSGTRYVATSSTPGTGLPPRIIRFQFSNLQTYVLELGATASGVGYVAFYTNAAQILLGGAPYTITSPYALADLPLLKFTQSADVMTLTHPSYPVYQLKRYADTVWTLTELMVGAQQAAPTAGTVASSWGSESAASGDAGTTTYRYQVTAVSSGGEESEPCTAFANAANSRIMSDDGNVYQTVTWTAATGTPPAYYNIYRQAEVPNGAAPTGAIYGLLGSANGVQYVDRNGTPDFATCPPQGTDPFAILQAGAIASVTVTAGGASYSAATYITLTDSTGSGAVLQPVIVSGVLIAINVLAGGANYSGPAIAVVDPGVTAPSGGGSSSSGSSDVGVPAPSGNSNSGSNSPAGNGNATDGSDINPTETPSIDDNTDTNPGDASGEDGGGGDGSDSGGGTDGGGSGGGP